jgi:plastocyanin
MKLTTLARLLPLALALAASHPVAAQSSNKGALAGTVTFKGTPPKRAAIDTKSAPDCTKKLLDEKVIVGAKGGLADVHVRIQSGTAGTHTAPKTAVQIDQKDCMYRPRVTGAMVGQEFSVSNSDATMHNVHGYRDKKTVVNRGQPAKTAAIKIDKKLPKAGEVFKLACDVHPWMVSFAPITDHPFFDVTSDDGAFEIIGLSEGKSYTLEAWHPEYGLKTQTVKAGDKKIRFVFP